MAKPRYYKPFYRRQLLIYPNFQLKLIGVNVLVMAAALGFVAFQLKRSFINLYEVGISAQIPPGHTYFRFLDWQLEQLYSYFMLAFAAGFLLSLAVTLVLSNRLAGPIVRLRTYFTKISNTGMPSEKIKFRKGDFFPELPEAINLALERIHEDSKQSEKKRAA